MSIEIVKRIDTPQTANVSPVFLETNDQLVLRLFPTSPGLPRPFQMINIAFKLPDGQGVETALVEFIRHQDENEGVDTIEMQLRLRSWPGRRGLLTESREGFVHAKYHPIIRIERTDGTVQKIDGLGIQASGEHRRGIQFAEWMDSEQNDVPLEFVLDSDETNPNSLLSALKSGRVTLSFEEHDIDGLEGIGL